MITLPIFTLLDYAHICAFVCTMVTYRLLSGVVSRFPSVKSFCFTDLRTRALHANQAFSSNLAGIPILGVNVVDHAR